MVESFNPNKQELGDASTSPSEELFQHVPIPFMEGYELYIGGGEVYDEHRREIKCVHIWKDDGTMEKDGNDGTKELTGAGFYKVMNFVETELKSRGIRKFSIVASDDQRQRVFESWAIRRGCTIEERINWYDKPVKVVTFPDHFSTSPSADL